jgi:MYXO-CTERM domain-containing protein
MKLVHLGIASAVSIASLVARAPRAEACGGFFCQNVPVDQTGEQILFAVENGRVEAQIKVDYAGAAEEFSWVVPVPSLPEVGVSSNRVFGVMKERAGIRFELSMTYDGNCMYPPMSAEGGGVRGDATSDAGTGVTVVTQSQVGPYDYAILQATDTLELFDWLAANDYIIPATAAPLVEPYVLMGDQMHFVAFKLQKDRTVGEIAPVVLKYDDDQPMIPIQLTAIATQPDLGVTVGLLGDARAVPENYLHVLINEARIDWLSSGSNYDALINDAMDEAGGQAFTTEFAGASDRFANAFFTEGQMETSQLALTADPVAFFGLVQSEGFAADAQLLEIIGRCIPIPASLVASGVDQRTFLNNLEGYRSELAGFDFDEAACANELEAAIVAPLRHAQELFDSLPYFTRLHTSLSAEEMTVDPVFAFNREMGDVDNVHRATAVMVCDSPSDYGALPIVVTLSDGREVLTSFSGSGLVNAMPGAAALEQTNATGAPVAVPRTDGRSPLAELAAHNVAAAKAFPDRSFELNPGDGERRVGRAASDGGCSTGGNAAGLFGLVGLGLLALRRRRAA